MASLGVWNELKLLRWAPEAAYLDGGDDGDVLLPLNQVPPGSKPGQMLKVFVYLDAEDLFAASTRVPIAQLGDVANLKVMSTNKAGVFLDWGLPQNLFLPWKEVKYEQKRLIKAGQKILVILFTDEDGRVIASTRLEDFLSDEAEEFQEGEKVTLTIGDPTDIGVRVVVNNRYWGMVHSSDIFGKLTKGETREGYIKALRADHKLNIALSAPGYAKVDAIAQGILDLLKRRGGFLAVTDKSNPEQIYELFGVSKKAFKQTLGTLYKNRRIVIEPDGIRLATGNQE
jgi:predicted RNA-binding protein (virulence factor B family)